MRLRLTPSWTRSLHRLRHRRFHQCLRRLVLIHSQPFRSIHLPMHLLTPFSPT